MEHQEWTDGSDAREILDKTDGEVACQMGMGVTSNGEGQETRDQGRAFSASDPRKRRVA